MSRIVLALDPDENHRHLWCLLPVTRQRIESHHTSRDRQSIGNQQLAAVPEHRYLAAWERLQRFVMGTGRSPVPEREEAIA